MKAEITLENICRNPSLAMFFLSDQSENKLNDIYSEYEVKGLEKIESECEQASINMDGLNDILHNETYEEIINYFGL